MRAIIFILILALVITLNAKRINDPKTRVLHTAEALNDEVVDLPDLKFELGFRMFSGYLELPDNEDGNDRFIFYWYVESQNDPENDPFVYWTNGGPGCSGLQGFGFIHGPFLFGNNGILENLYSWNRISNLLYIEQPIGVGFSYSTTDYEPYTDAKSAEEQYQVLVSFYKKFPTMKSNDLYLTSESYGGHYIPQLALYILEEVQDTSFNLKGLALGNPSTDYGIDEPLSFVTFYNRGLVREDLMQSWRVNKCKNNYRLWKDFLPRGDCYDIEDEIFDGTGTGFNWGALDYPICISNISSSLTQAEDRGALLSPDGVQLLKMRLKGNLVRERLQNKDERQRKVFAGFSQAQCSKEYFKEYVNREDVQKAIHARPTAWDTCNDDVFWNWSIPDYYTAQQKLWKKLIEGNHTLNIMIYSGDNDGIVPYIATSRWIHQLGVDPKENFNWKDWLVNNQQAGFVTDFKIPSKGRFLFVVVHSAGHEVPFYKPVAAFNMWERYLSNSWGNLKRSEE